MSMSEGLRFFSVVLFFLASAFLVSCKQEDTRHRIIISIPDQKLVLLTDNTPTAIYPISSSKFGISSQPGSYGTPLGKHKIQKKIGEGLPPGAVLKSRVFTGEILPVNAEGRDPIVTRILWLEGLEPRNRNSYDRFIYIHGTPEERRIGEPASYGCIRMKSSDIMQLFEIVGYGARVQISEDHLNPKLLTGQKEPGA
ncbi:MAG: L,D-transpeptidase family protein [Chthoniobacterales bacterium]